MREAATGLGDDVGPTAGDASFSGSVRNGQIEGVDLSEVVEGEVARGAFATHEIDVVVVGGEWWWVFTIDGGTRCPGSGLTGAIVF